LWALSSILLTFFAGKPLLTTEEYPFDLDTTSLGLMMMNDHEDIVHSVMDEMLDYIDDDGIIQASVLS
jgi:hypothetical protein